MPAAPSTFVISTRALDRRGRFVAEPGSTRFFRVPRGLGTYDPSFEIKSRERWRLLVADAADGEEDEVTGTTGDVLVFVHGYSNDIDIVLWRTETLRETLEVQGWRGTVVAFDWPSDNTTLNYLEDRADAAAVADRLVADGVKLLALAQNDPARPCTLNVHLLGHSTGAYVIMEAFAQAMKDGALFKSDWRVAQCVFVAGDVAQSSLSATSEWAAPMFGRSMRVTNYACRHDKVLGVSNAKRLGTAPRAGRVGLPADAHPKAVDVDCSDYFATKDPRTSRFKGTFNHSWHVGDPVFALDLAMTLEGAIDRAAIPTRRRSDHGLVLTPGVRPAFQAGWDAASPTAARRRLTTPSGG